MNHGLWYGGAQISTIEFLKLIRNEVEVRAVLCRNADPKYIRDLNSLHINVFRVPCRKIHYPDMRLNAVRDIIKWADIIWISDVSYIAAYRIKSICNIPIIAHLRSYALICPLWNACFGLEEQCLRPCSMRRFVKCIYATRNKMLGLGATSSRKARLSKALSLSIGTLLYFWFLRTKNIVNYVDGFIAVSKAMQYIIKQHIPSIGNKPFKVIYNPVIIPSDIINKSLEKRRDSDTVNIVFIDPTGRGSLHKGPHIFVQTLRILNKLTDVELKLRAHIVGCKDTWVKDYACKLGVPNVRFYSKLPRIDVYKLIASSHMAVVPSICPEPFGRVALEANYLGVPVVASKIGGLPEIVRDGVTGFLVKPNNPLDLAKGIIKVLQANFSREEIHSVTDAKFNVKRIKDDFLRFLSKCAR